MFIRSAALGIVAGVGPARITGRSHVVHAQDSVVLQDSTYKAYTVRYRESGFDLNGALCVRSNICRAFVRDKNYRRGSTS